MAVLLWWLEPEFKNWWNPKKRRKIPTMHTINVSLSITTNRLRWPRLLLLGIWFGNSYPNHLGGIALWVFSVYSLRMGDCYNFLLNFWTVFPVLKRYLSTTQVILLTTDCTHKKLIRTRKKKCDFTFIATFVKISDKPSTFSIMIIEELYTYLSTFSDKNSVHPTCSS
jgi:hypothetical protein